MNDVSILLIVLAALLALAGAWLLWGKPLAALRGTLAARAEAFGKTEAECAALKQQAVALEERARDADSLALALAKAETALVERERSTAEALEERARQHEEQLRHLREEFERLAGKALEQAQNRFTEQAAETLKLHRAETEKELLASKEAMAGLMQPMRDTLGRYETQLKAIEEKRERAYGSLGQQLEALAQSQESVRKEANRIVRALRGSAKASGNWGEAQLRRVLELAGLKEGIDFELQETVTADDGGRRRPDAVLKMPGGREIIIDSKCSLDAYIRATEADEDTARAAALKEHAKRVREHMTGLASRAYWDAFGSAADFVLLFMPGDNFLTAAMEQDRELHPDAMKQRILLVGPTMLLAVARVVAMVWRQEKMADEARRIGTLGSQLYERLLVMTDHLNRVGKNIDQTARAWNQLVGSVESRLLVTGRAFGELGVNDKGKPLPELQRADTSIRYLQSTPGGE